MELKEKGLLFNNINKKQKGTIPVIWKSEGRQIIIMISKSKKKLIEANYLSIDKMQSIWKTLTGTGVDLSIKNFIEGIHS